MSCYIVERLTINEIVTDAYLDANTRAYLQTKGYDLEKLAGRDKLSYDLIEMNREAFKERYNEKIAKLTEIYNDKLETTNKYQILKDAKCLLYQCSEGDIPEMELYKILENLIYIWTDEILDNLPEYQKAIWR